MQYTLLFIIYMFLLEWVIVVGLTYHALPDNIRFKKFVCSLPMGTLYTCIRISVAIVCFDVLCA